MVSVRVGAALLAAALLTACNSSSTPATAPSASPPVASAAPARPSLELIELETGGAGREDTLPLVVAMHGLGDRPDAFAGLYAGFPGRARIAVLRAPDPWGDGYAWFPFRPSDGDALRAKGISAAAARVASTIEALEKSRPTRGKAIVTGFSQGGMISFALAASRPSLVQAAIPIGGVLPEPLWPAADLGKKTGVRVIALHGEADELVPVGPTRQSVDALVRAGWDARIETFPGVGHRIPSQVRVRYFEILAEEVARDSANAK